MKRSHDQPGRHLITGASRGLGLEFTRQWLARGDRVVALARRPETSEGLRELARRHPETLKVVACDVADDASVEKAKRTVEAAESILDLVVNNAGTFGSREGALEKLNFVDVRRTFEVNTLGPIRISRAFLPLLEKGANPRLVHITSMMGSISDNKSGGYWDYRMSKAALNMASRNLAVEVGPRGIASILLSPGWVRTDMGGPGAPLSPEQSVADLIRTIDGLGSEHSGGFFDRDGKPLPF